MYCPYCNHNETKVVDKRDSDSSTRRRRECIKCEKRFTTHEKPEISLIIVKRDGSKEPYDRDKIRSGLFKSCGKRIGKEAIEEIVSDTESKLLKMSSTEVKSSSIGALVLKKLLKLDKVAYLRFASVYRKFEDIKEFEKEVKLIKTR
jgi:transcriptional repressor NrdR